MRRAALLGHRLDASTVPLPSPANRSRRHPPAPPLLPVFAPAPAGSGRLQRMEFLRFQGLSRVVNWFYSDTETQLLARERRLRDFLADMQSAKEWEGGEEIAGIENRFQEIESATYGKERYAEISRELNALFYRLDGISSRIAAAQVRFEKRYGAGNEDLMQVELKRKNGEKAGALAKAIVAFLDQVPAPLRTEKNLVLLKKAVHPDVESVGFREDWLGDSDVEFARGRGKMVLANLVQMTQRVLGDWKGLQKEFGLGGDLKAIHLTGSDFHNEGQQVAILESTKGQKAVYKPRSVAPDQGLVGTKDSAFSDLNEIGEGALQLPTMGLRQREDEKGAYGYAQFVERTFDKPVEEVRTYYERLAQTIVASKLLGVNDLHSENVMATQGSPSLIDAETAFLPYVVTARALSKTGVTWALSTFKSIQTGELENNAFLTPGERQTWNQLTPEEKEERKLSTFEEYVSERRRNDLNGEQNYLESFERGLETVLAVLSLKKKEIAKMLEVRFGAMTSTRVVPFATLEFTQRLALYHDLLRAGRDKDAKEIPGVVVELIAKALVEKGFELKSSAEAVLLKGVHRDFEIRDTPVLQFHPKSNTLTYHDVVIARHGEWTDPKSAIRDNLEWIAALKREEILKDLGVGK